VGAAAPAAPLRAVSPSQASFGELLRARLPAAPEVRPAGVRLLAQVEQARARLDAALAEARRGRAFTAGELLSLQGDAYRASQTLELASRLVEQGAQSVRQAVNTQV
jgi:hypothetical protein